MKKHINLLAFAIFCLAGKLAAQTYSPVATTGYTLDAVAENTTAAVTTAGSIDGSNYILYSQYYGTLFSTSATGLPNSGIISSSTRTYQLQSYTNTPNVMYLTANTADTLVFTSPAPYPSVSLLGFATEGAGTLSVTVRFTDNSTQQFTSLSLPDWFNSTATAFYSGFDRAGRTSGTPGYSTGFPKFYTVDLNIACANLAKSIQRIIIQNTSTARLCIMAASVGTPTYVPIPVSSSTNAVCSGGSATFSASTMNSYTWQPVGGFSGSNNGTISVTPTTTTTYSLFGTNAAGCPGYTTVAINASSVAPVLNLSGSTSTVCLGGAATLTASGALTYTLSTAAANGSTFAPSATAQYTVSGTNACGTSSTTTSITVTPLPVTASASSTLVCASTPATLTAGGATTYSWSPGASTQTNYIVSPASTTTYVVTGKTGVCIGTNTIVITTKQNPTLSITPSSTAICNGDAANLTVLGNAVTYTWSVNSQTASNISVSPTITSAYSVIGTNALSCTTAVSQVIIVKPLPVITANVSDDLVCTGGASTLTAAGGTAYAWSNSGTSAATVVNPTITSSYTVVGTSSLGCNNSTVVTVNVFSPTLSVSNGTAVCKGSSALLNANGMDAYAWSNGSVFQSITVTPTISTTYTVTGSSTQGAVTCTNSGMVTVSVNPNPTVTAVASPTGICRGESAVLSGNGASTYTWAAPTSSTSTNVTVTPTQDQTYSVTGTDVNGCKNTGGVVVKVFTCLGISASNANTTNLVIYPNPNNGEFSISANQAIDLRVTNELGQQVMSISLNGNNSNDVKISSLSAGVYFITGANENGSVKQKIIIAK